MSTKQTENAIFEQPHVRSRKKPQFSMLDNSRQQYPPDLDDEICFHLTYLDEMCILKSLNQKLMNCIKCTEPATMMCAERKCALRDRTSFCLQSDHIFPHYRDTQHRLMIHISKRIIVCNSCSKRISAERLLELRDKRLVEDNGIFWIDEVTLPLGTTGLFNVGNTCYANAAIQVLAHCPPLVTYFKDWKVETGDIKEHLFADLFSKLINILYSKSRFIAIDPSELVDIVRCKTWNFFPVMQHDSQEFMKSFLDVLNNDLQQSTSQETPSIVDNLFGGVMESCITCSGCNNVSVTKEVFTELALPLDESSERSNSIDLNGNDQTKHDGIIKSTVYKNSDEIKLSECFDKFFKTTPLVDENKYFCDKCKKHVNAIKTLKLCELPNVLSIQLKRFRYNQIVSSKIDNPVLSSFKDLDLSTYSNTTTDAKYDLFGFITHEGIGSDCGHYIAYCKSMGNNGWYQFEDSRVHRIDDVTNQMKDAYVLMYMKNDYNSESDQFSIAENANSDGPSCYVLKNWWMSVRSGKCMPFDHSSVFCQHGFIKPEMALLDNNFVQLPEKLYTKMHKIVGGDKMLKNLEICKTCHEDIHNRELKQHRISCALNMTDDWVEFCRQAIPSALYENYLPDAVVNTDWLKTLAAYLGDPFVEEPGAISNQTFEKHMEKMGDTTVITSDLPNAHRLVLESYNYLKKTFGGGPDVFFTDAAQPTEIEIEEIDRHVIDNEKETISNIEKLLEHNSSEVSPSTSKPSAGTKNKKKKNKK